MCSPMKAPWDPQGAHSNQLAVSVAAVSLLSPRSHSDSDRSPDRGMCLQRVLHARSREEGMLLNGCIPLQGRREFAPP